MTGSEKTDHLLLFLHTVAVNNILSSYNSYYTVRAFPGKWRFSHLTRKDGSVPCLRSRFRSTIVHLVKRHFVESV